MFRAMWLQFNSILGCRHCVWIIRKSSACSNCVSFTRRWPCLRLPPARHHEIWNTNNAFKYGCWSHRRNCLGIGMDIPRLNYHGQEIQGWIEGFFFFFFFLWRAWRKSKAGWRDGGGRERVKECNKRFHWQKIGLRSIANAPVLSTWVWEGGIKNSVIFKHDHHFGEIMRVLNAGWQTHTLTRSFLPCAYMKDNTSFNYRDMSDDENSPAMSFLSNTLAN